MKAKQVFSVEEYRALISKKGKPKKNPSGDRAKAKMEWDLKYIAGTYTKEYTFHPTRKWRFDFAIVEHKLAIEYNGIMSDKSRHTTVKGYTGDMEKINEANKLGWTVFQYTPLNYKTMGTDVRQFLENKKK